MIAMLRRAVPCIALLLTSGTVAAAAECPPGDWFCEPSPVPTTPPPEEANPTPPPPAQAPDEPNPQVFRPERPQFDLRVPPPPPPISRFRHRGWGIRTHLMVPLVDSDAASNYSMAGLGIGGRARPDEAVALDLSLDSMAGVDYSGHRRTELALDFSTTVFFNPRDRVQGFLLAGLGWSRADVSYKVHEMSAAGAVKSQHDDTYYYFGLFAGLGVEWRFDSRWSTDLALIGFLRNRMDSKAENNPEFVDPKTKLATNSSGFGLLRLGLNYYF